MHPLFSIVFFKDSDDHNTFNRIYCNENNIFHVHNLNLFTSTHENANIFCTALLYYIKYFKPKQNITHIKKKAKNLKQDLLSWLACLSVVSLNPLQAIELSSNINDKSSIWL